MNCFEVATAILEKAKQYDVDNIEFNGFEECIGNNSQTNEYKALPSVFSSKEEFDNFIRILSKECDSYRNGDCSVIKKYIKVQNYILVFIRKESFVLNNLGKDLLHIRAVKQI